MAVVSTKKSESSKYSYLNRVYSGNGDENNIQIDNSENEKKVKVKKTKIQINKKEIVRNIALICLLAVIGVLGYVWMKIN